MAQVIEEEYLGEEEEEPAAVEHRNSYLEVVNTYVEIARMIDEEEVINNI